MSLQADIRNIIQETYGDATQTVLDDECARRIVARVAQNGVSWDVLATVVASAGGRVEIDDRYVFDPPQLLISTDAMSTGRVLTTRPRVAAPSTRS